MVAQDSVNKSPPTVTIGAPGPEDEDGSCWPPGTPSALHVETRAAVVSTACHPRTGDVVVGCDGGKLAVLACLAETRPV